MPINVFDAAVNTYNYDYIRSAVDGQELIKFPVKLKASTTFAKGVVLVEVTATPGVFAPHGEASSSIGRAVLPIACVTDAAGDITIGSQPANRAVEHLTVEAIFGGYVNTEDIPSLTTGQAAELGKIVRGTVTNGILSIGEGQ
jgi:hypothetical protein